jgi:phosphoglycerol transferase
MMCVLIAAVVLNVTPTVLNENGANLAAAARHPGHAEVLGLKITQLVLPINDHRLHSWSELKRFYNSYSVSSNENVHSSLGLVGAVGFLLLIGWAIIAPRASSPNGLLLEQLGRLQILAVLLATMGGLGAIVALVTSANIRAYNRLVLYIAFFSFAAVAIVIDWLNRRYGAVLGVRVALGVLLPAVLLFGALDQFSPMWTPPHGSNKTKYAYSADFVSKLETFLPEGAMVFQLPFMSFPEQSHPNLPDYEHLSLYLPSTKIHWSYGAMRGREPEAWQRSVAAMRAGPMIASLALRGFAGIHVDRAGYPDNGVLLERTLAVVIEDQPVVSANGRHAFYPLKGFADKYMRTLSSADQQFAKDTVSQSLAIEFGSGTWDHEQEGSAGTHWCDKSAEIRLINPSSRPRMVEFAMKLIVPTPDPARMRFDSNLFTDSVYVKSNAPYKRTISLPPGRHSIRITTDAPRLQNPDFRRLHSGLPAQS